MFICRDCLKDDPTCAVGYDGHIVLSFGACGNNYIAGTLSHQYDVTILGKEYPVRYFRYRVKN
jgi:hypothetical protein